MPKHGADGDVLDVNLTTVRVQNWDKTVSTIPTHELVTGSFKNWRGMQESGGRRINVRFTLICALSVRKRRTFRKFKSFEILKPYLEGKLKEVDAHNADLNADPPALTNGRRPLISGPFVHTVSHFSAVTKKSISQA